MQMVDVSEVGCDIVSARLRGVSPCCADRPEEEAKLRVSTFSTPPILGVEAVEAGVCGTEGVEG